MSEEKTIHFVAGLPRSGSTLFCNILMQNPRFHATATSGILEVLYAARNKFSELPQFQAMKEEEFEVKTRSVLKGILNSWFTDTDRPVVFDKSRGYEAYLEMAEAALGRKPKLICCVRDLREVMASLEKLWRKSSANRQIPDERADFWSYQHAEGRWNKLLNAQGGIVGGSIVRIRDAMVRGWEDSIKFVDYDILCKHPKRVMRDVYDFLDEKEFEHDFNNVVQVTYENDLVWTYKDLHKIRPKVEVQEHTWHKIWPETLTDNIPVKPKQPGQVTARFWESLLSAAEPINRLMERSEDRIDRLRKGEKD